MCVPCRIKRSSSSVFIIFTFFSYNYARLNIYTNAHKTPGRLILPGKKSLLIYKGSGQKMYSVPMEIPQFCNKCPFGACNYNFPHSGSSISMLDRKENRTGTYGYVCNLDFYKNGEYTKILRADVRKDIKKPAWCGLKETT